MSVGTIASLAGDEPNMRGMILFDFPSGNYGFWDGNIEFDHNGVIYRPGGSLLEVEQINANAGLEAESFRVSLKAIPEEGLTPDVLATIEEEDYVNRPVTLYMAYYDADGGLINVERIRRYYVDIIPHEDELGGATKLVCYLESKALDNSRRGYRVRSPADQSRTLAGDQGLDHVAVAGQQEINWGRLPQKAA